MLPGIENYDQNGPWSATFSFTPQPWNNTEFNLQREDLDFDPSLCWIIGNEEKGGAHVGVVFWPSLTLVNPHRTKTWHDPQLFCEMLDDFRFLEPNNFTFVPRSPLFGYHKIQPTLDGLQLKN